ncbi:MAG: glycosyltransferase [Candidatus Phosphoribacter sp.]|nr:glycosyltransferase [Actinomycetales bacterium]
MTVDGPRDRPLFSLLTPVYNPDLSVLADTIASVLAQTDPGWEWVLVDDASPDERVRVALRSAAAADPRIILIERPENGHIVAASNTGLEHARGEFVVLLDHDDLLVPHALERVRSVLAAAPDADYLYSDEDKVAGRRQFAAFHKPDWSPTRLRGHMYTGHVSVLRRSVIQTVGGFQPGLEGSQDHDLVLRVAERARRVVHIPEVLYHWRLVAGSTAADPSEKPYAWYAGGRAVDAHLRRLGIGGHAATLPGRVGYYRHWVDLPPHRSVSVVIAVSGDYRTVGGARMPAFVPALRGVLERTRHERVDAVIAADSRVTSRELAVGLNGLTVDTHLVRCAATEPLAGRLNAAILAATGDVVLILGERIVPETDGFLERLCGSLEEPGVGLVGPLVLGPANDIRYAGHRHHHGRYDHAFAGATHREQGSWASLWVAREVSGLALAAVAVRREDLLAVGGVCEVLPGPAAEVDLSLKLRAVGKRLIWLPDVWARTDEPIHDRTVDAAAAQALIARWGEPRWDSYLPD